MYSVTRDFGIRLCICVVALLGFLNSTARAEQCSSLHEGVVQFISASMVRYISTAKVKALSTDERSIEIAVAEARVAARQALIDSLSQDKSLRDSRLRGALDYSTCISTDVVYSIVRYSEATKKQATQLNDGITESLNRYPTPKP